MSKLKRWLSVLAVLLVAGVCVAVAVGVALSRPVPAVIGPPPTRLNAREIRFPSRSGAVVHGWWLPSSHSRGSVLLLPGVRANRLSMLSRAEFLRRAEYSVLLVDLQATGETAGPMITFGWRERLDVLAAVAFIRTQAPKLPVAIIGMSLGGAAALLATPPLRVDALILESVYPSIDRAVRNRLAIRVGFLSEVLAPILLFQLKPRIGVGTSTLRPVDHIAEAACPVLVISGTADRHTTETDTLQLYSAARTPKELWLVSGASHVDIHRAHPKEYEGRVLAFLEKAFQRRSA